MNKNLKKLLVITFVFSCSIIVFGAPFNTDKWKTLDSLKKLMIIPCIP
jgi:hypothetical protein